MTSTNPYRSPRELDPGVTARQKPTAFAVRRSILGAVTLGCLGYVGPFVIQSLLDRAQFGPTPISTYFADVAHWHWPLRPTGLSFLVPNVMCMFLFGIAGFYGFPNRLWFKPARAFLCVGLLTLVSVLSYGTVVMFIHSPPDSWSLELNLFVYVAASVAGPIAMLVRLAFAERTRR